MSAKMKLPPFSDAPIRSLSGLTTNIQNSQRYRSSEIDVSSLQSCLTSLIWSVLLTWGLFVVPPGDSFFAKDVTRMLPIDFFAFLLFFFWFYFALEKFLRVQHFFSLFWMMFFQSQSRKEDWKRSKRNEDVSTAAVGRGKKSRSTEDRRAEK